MKTFAEAIVKDLQAGCIKFDGAYVSQEQLYNAAVKLVEQDENVLEANVRPGGITQWALDFHYKDEKGYGGKLLEKVLKPFFTEYFGQDYVVGWDFGTGAAVVK